MNENIIHTYIYIKETQREKVTGTNFYLRYLQHLFCKIYTGNQYYASRSIQSSL